MCNESISFGHEDPNLTYRTYFFDKALPKLLNWSQVHFLNGLNPYKNSNYGEHLILFDGKGFLVGGHSKHDVNVSQKTLMEETNDLKNVLIHGHDLITMTNVKDFSSCEQIQTYLLSNLDVYNSATPSSLKDHTLHLGSFASGPVFLLYGGRFESSNETLVDLNSHVLGFNLLSKCWVVLDNPSNCCPPARHSHASAIVPMAGSGSSLPEYTEYLIIFGGLGFPWVFDHNKSNNGNSSHVTERASVQGFLSDLVVLNDLWIFNFLAATWTCIELSCCPQERFGMSFIWLDASNLFMYGGEARTLLNDYLEEDISLDIQRSHRFALPYGRSILLNDSWCLHIDKIKLEEIFSNGGSIQTAVEWKQFPDDGTNPFRSHYASIGLTAWFPCFTYCQQKGLNFYECQDVWWTYHVKETLEETKDTRWETVRLLFLISGTTMNCDAVMYEVSNVFVGLVINTQSSTLPFKIVWKTINVGCVPKNQPFLGRRGHSVTFLQTFYDSTHTMDTQDSQTKEEGLLLSRPQKYYCLFVSRGITSTGENRDDFYLLHLSSLLPNVYDNKIGSSLKSQNKTLLKPHFSKSNILSLVSLPNNDKFATLSQIALSKQSNLFSPNVFHIFQSVWNHSALNFQSSVFQKGPIITRNFLFSLASMIRHPFSCVGYFLENSYSSKTNASTVHVSFEEWNDCEVLIFRDDGNGLSYTELYWLVNQFGHTNFSKKQNFNTFHLGFKFASSRLSHHCLVLTKTQDSYGVALFSPPLNAMLQTLQFVSPVVSWSRESNAPLSLSLDEADFQQRLHLILKYSPLQTTQVLQKEFQNFKHVTGSQFILFGLRKDLPYFYRTNDNQITFTSYRNPTLFTTPKASILYPKYNKFETNDNQLPTTAVKEGTLGAIGSIDLDEHFPMFQCSQRSFDYNLATYMYWFHLNAKQELYLNNCLISSNPSTTPSAKICKSEKQSLWDFLKEKLTYKLYLNNIHVEDHDDSITLLLGFLNKNITSYTSNLQPYEESKTVGCGDVCETGILFYSEGRLVKRALSCLPGIPELITPISTNTEPVKPSSFFIENLITAVINFPSSFHLKPTKENFDSTHNASLDHLNSQLDDILQTYSQIFHDDAKLKEYEASYNSRHTTQNCLV
ncbi:uncharacterized protein LOC128883320 [Hylaeus volcanicus]|uniref:uncharacterized protein LOC128883320 n=1 Tax=Hylaeus volcanicus TaxID=313075 RepID=UPI0023B78ECD|nr:uncharacterized protein LOC128883320 [Hylaeus volcanicus]